MKETADYYSYTRPEIAAFVPKNIKTILDVGCGEGAFLKLIKEQTGAETWGIEVAFEVAEKAKGHIDKIVTGKVEDVLNSIPNAYFNCITFNDVLEHLLEPTEVLKMIRPKLSENGIVIASIPNVRYFRNLYNLLVKKDWEYTDAGILDSTHFRFFTQKSMKRMFEDAGYNLIKQVGVNKIIWRKFQLFNLLTLLIFNDTKYFQFCCIAKTN
jgi:2-polyprenyl-3-methyl-5-hydroxy-6-metoxy-1,4-benzoquinol methylase